MVVAEKLRWVEINDIGYFRAYERGESNWSWEGGEKRDGGNWRLQLLEGKGRGWPSLRGHLIPLSASDGESIFAVRPSHTAAAQILGMHDKIIVLFHVDV